MFIECHMAMGGLKSKVIINYMWSMRSKTIPIKYILLHKFRALFYLGVANPANNVQSLCPIRTGASVTMSQKDP